MDVIDHAGLSPERLDEVRDVVRAHTTLEYVIHWGLAHRPPLMVADVVAQDEYTHDVVVPWRDGLVFVYDTT